jgi:hypothetical protein
VWVLHARLLGGDEWAPYVEALPKTFDSPVHWDDDDGGGWGEAAGAAAAAEKVIEGTPLGEAVASKRRWLARLHAALPAALRESGLGELATVLIRPCTVLCHGPGCHPMLPASWPVTGGIIGSASLGGAAGADGAGLAGRHWSGLRQRRRRRRGRRRRRRLGSGLLL